MSHVSPCHFGPVVPVCPCLGNRGLGVLGSTCMRGREETQRERSMVDFRAETASSTDKTEFTETEDQSRTHQRRKGRSAASERHVAVLVVLDFAWDEQTIHFSMHAAWPWPMLTSHQNCPAPGPAASHHLVKVVSTCVP